VSGNTVVARTTGDEDTFHWGLERFIVEARSLAEFRQHPNIVSVLRYFKANNTGYMVMQYAGAVSLQDYLEQHVVLSEAQVRALVFPLLDALEQIHAVGIIHRDLKPGNILINTAGQPVLIDFGSARQAFGHKSMNLTAIVSPGYSPFEQYTATGKQGAWTDIYALAAVMYRCVTGQMPPDSLGRMAADAQTLRTAEQVTEPYSPGLLAAIDWGLQVQVADRPQSVAAWRVTMETSASVEDAIVNAHPVALQHGFRSSLVGIRNRVTQDRRWLFAPLLAGLLVSGVSLFVHGYSADAGQAQAIPQQQASVETARQVQEQEQALKTAAVAKARLAEEERKMAEEAATAKAAADAAKAEEYKKAQEEVKKKGQAQAKAQNEPKKPPKTGTKKCAAKNCKGRKKPPSARVPPSYRYETPQPRRPARPKNLWVNPLDVI
jgi:hypothetical protein